MDTGENDERWFTPWLALCAAVRGFAVNGEPDVDQGWGTDLDCFPKACEGRKEQQDKEQASCPGKDAIVDKKEPSAPPNARAEDSFFGDKHAQKLRR